MPSSPNYKRDLKQERKTAIARGEMEKDRVRHRARYAMEKAGKATKGDGKDVDHIKALSKGGTNAPGNLRMRSASANRSFKRKSDGSMK